MHHRAKAFDTFGYGTVDVFLAEGLAGRAKHDDLIGVGLQRRLKALGESFEQKRAEADVPEVDIRKGDKQRTERVARKFFK